MGSIGVQLPATRGVLGREPITIVVRDPESGEVLLLRSGREERVFTLDGMQVALIGQLRDASASVETCTQPTDAAVPTGPESRRTSRSARWRRRLVAVRR